MSMSMGSFLIGRIRVPMFDLDRMWKETSYGMDQAMGSIASQEGRNLCAILTRRGLVYGSMESIILGAMTKGDHWRVFDLRVFSS